MSKFGDLVNRHEQFKERSGLNHFNLHTTRNVIKMEASRESMGLIHSIFETERHVWAIIMRADSPTFELNCSDGLDGVSFFNCDGDYNSKSPYELLIPISNIDLSIQVLDLRKLIGGSVMVSELYGKAVKAEYVGELTRPDETPLKFSRKIFDSVRNYIGAYTRLDDEQPSVVEVLDRFGIDRELSKKLYETSIEDWGGNVIRIENEAVFTNDVMQPKEGELIIKAHPELHKYLKERGMKTKLCHLPVKIFSAR